MDGIKFEWDKAKNDTNVKKHKIGFEEASTVFYDPYAIQFDDPEHSIEEDRFLIIGLSKETRLCIVSHCYRDDEKIIRIISARKATSQERQIYVSWRNENER